MGAATDIITGKLNIIESIGLSIATGLAVDYVLHLAHSYNHQHGTAAEKSRAALAEMGISITSGCATTFFACIGLFCCDFKWFYIFGVFITILIFSSFFTSMGGMMAALSWLGPAEAPDGVLPLPSALQKLLLRSAPVEMESELTSSRSGSGSGGGGGGGGEQKQKTQIQSNEPIRTL